jgi:5'-phosphate synthase pdxT subunit
MARMDPTVFAFAAPRVAAAALRATSSQAASNGTGHAASRVAAMDIHATSPKGASNGTARAASGARPLGVLALQGGFEAHAEALRALGHEVLLVRSARALDACGGLVLPGGESTVMLKMLAEAGLRASLAVFVASGRPVLATCAGLILSAARVLDPEQPSFGFLDVTVRRNGWGRQLASFEARDDGDEIPVVAIRAPRIVDVGPRVRVLATLRGEPILVREANVTGATFHPELTSDLTVHASVFGYAGERAEPMRRALRVA